MTNPDHPATYSIPPFWTYGLLSGMTAAVRILLAANLIDSVIEWI